MGIELIREYAVHCDQRLDDGDKCRESCCYGVVTREGCAEMAKRDGWVNARRRWFCKYCAERLKIFQS